MAKSKSKSRAAEDSNYTPTPRKNPPRSNIKKQSTFTHQRSRITIPGPRRQPKATESGDVPSQNQGIQGNQEKQGDQGCSTCATTFHLHRHLGQSLLELSSKWSLAFERWAEALGLSVEEMEWQAEGTTLVIERERQRRHSTMPVMQSSAAGSSEGNNGAYHHHPHNAGNQGFRVPTPPESSNRTYHHPDNTNNQGFQIPTPPESVSKFVPMQATVEDAEEEDMEIGNMDGSLPGQAGHDSGLVSGLGQA